MFQKVKKKQTLNFVCTCDRKKKEKKMTFECVWSARDIRVGDKKKKSVVAKICFGNRVLVNGLFLFYWDCERNVVLI